MVLCGFQGTAYLERAKMDKTTAPKREERGGVAQLGERLPCKQEASGSNPLISTMAMGS